jgi:hypothetical protein
MFLFALAAVFEFLAALKIDSRCDATDSPVVALREAAGGEKSKGAEMSR